MTRQPTAHLFPPCLASYLPVLLSGLLAGQHTWDFLVFCLHLTEATHASQIEASIIPTFYTLSTEVHSSGCFSNGMCWSSTTSKYVLGRSSLSHQQSNDLQPRSSEDSGVKPSSGRIYQPKCQFCAPGRDQEDRSTASCTITNPVLSWELIFPQSAVS